MKWRKLGQIYKHSSNHPKMISHASNPLAVHLQDDTFRIFFSTRDDTQRSSVGAVDIDIIKRTIVHKHDQPFCAHGPPGSYYESGISVGGTYSSNGNTYMLFMGWQSPQSQHWRGDIGRLLLRTDLTLIPYDLLPLLGSDSTDPLSLSYPWVERTANGSYLMWYGSTRTWDAGNGEMIHTINFATSDDGESWNRQGLSIPYEVGVAQAFSRPTVLVDESNIHHMWFSYRSGKGEQYRIGYAFSPNGWEWNLKLSEAGIEPSPSGWDSDMIEYPFVFRHKDSTYMLYNGNNFGKGGFGLAEMEK
jgi:hypothetical protein